MKKTLITLSGAILLASFSYGQQKLDVDFHAKWGENRRQDA